MADRIERLFKEIDTHQTGGISIKELRKMFEKLGVKLLIEDVRSVFYKYHRDSKKHGREMTLEEFRHLINDAFVANETYEEVREAFNVIDKDGSDDISPMEIRQACARMANKLSDDEIDDLINKMDADKNGTITFQEFARAYSCWQR